MLGQTDRRTDGQTNTGPTTFFQRPTRGCLRAKTFTAKALKPFYSTILSYQAAHTVQVHLAVHARPRIENAVAVAVETAVATAVADAVVTAVTVSGFCGKHRLT